MAAHDLPYFKFVSILIDSGIWGRMTAAARTLYPVLLRFSDASFKPVYPGTRTLLKLTGFKQKASLRRARKELVDLGLVSLTTGTGRKNTCYHFRFDFETDPQRDTAIPPTESGPAPSRGLSERPRGEGEGASGESAHDSRYNKIHISINNNVPVSGSPPGPDASAEQPAGSAAKKGTGQLDADRLLFFERRFGREMVDLAISECDLAGMPATAENLARLLYRDAPLGQASFGEVQQALQGRISPASLELIRAAFREEREGLVVFADCLPGHLRVLLQRVCDQVFFEPERLPVSSRREFWGKTGGNQ